MPEGAHPLPAWEEEFLNEQARRKGWKGEKFVPNDGTNWPLDVAASVLGIPEKDLRDLVRITGLQPVGVIRMASFRRQGRQPRAYDASKLCLIIDAVRDLREVISGNG